MAVLPVILTLEWQKQDNQKFKISKLEASLSYMRPIPQNDSLKGPCSSFRLAQRGGGGEGRGPVALS